MAFVVATAGTNSTGDMLNDSIDEYLMTETLGYEDEGRWSEDLRCKAAVSLMHRTVSLMHRTVGQLRFFRSVATLASSTAPSRASITGKPTRG
jgi:hypothetical protein